MQYLCSNTKPICPVHLTETLPRVLQVSPGSRLHVLHVLTSDRGISSNRIVGQRKFSQWRSMSAAIGKAGSLVPGTENCSSSVWIAQSVCPRNWGSIHGRGNLKTAEAHTASNILCSGGCFTGVKAAEALSWLFTSSTELMKCGAKPPRPTVFVVPCLINCRDKGRAVAQVVSSLASLRADPGSRPVQVMWDLWWTKRHWGMFSPSISIPPANHSSDCSTLIIVKKSSGAGAVDQ
jgi:hypothetical protein